ncbi:monocarboxylate transporter 6 [Hyalella azteca]|uniref:Monocarboxylate transporter 6 n=1 Tax=Hyalella azteca TaxID=294128 RepID=A0A8B7PFF1_HYAAZ|nr:monocarboxylate transporter 6 [Hyalella azteca]
MKKSTPVQSINSLPIGWSVNDLVNSTLVVPKIIVTSASFDILPEINAENTVPRDLRPLRVAVATEDHKPIVADGTEVAEGVVPDATTGNEAAGVTNLQYEWVGEPLGGELAPDGGWSWLVLMGAVFMALSLLSIAPCFGVLFNDVMQDQGVSSTTLAWVFNIHMFVWNITSVLCGALIKHFGWRVVGCTATFLLAVSFILMSLSRSPLFVFIMFGILIGGLGGTSIMVCFLILPAYFHKRRGMANSLFSAGIPIGYVIFPLLIRYLQEEYGFSGAVLIHGGLLLNCTVACALFRPLKSPQVLCRKREVNSRTDGQRTDPLLLQTTDTTKTIVPETETGAQSLTFCELCADILKTTNINLKGMKNRTLLLLSLSVALFLVSTMNYVSMLPFAMRAHGYSANEASYAVSLTGIGNIAVRVLVACIADSKWVNRKYVYITGLIIVSVCSFLTPFLMDSYSYLMPLFVVWGVGLAASSSMFLVLLIDMVGISNYESGTTVIVFLLAFISISAGPAFGHIRDKTSSYTWSLVAVAIAQASSALLWLFMPWAIRHTMKEARASIVSSRRSTRNASHPRLSPLPSTRNPSRRESYPAFRQNSQFASRRDSHPAHRLDSRQSPKLDSEFSDSILRLYGANKSSMVPERGASSAREPVSGMTTTLIPSVILGSEEAPPSIQQMSSMRES